MFVYGLRALPGRALFVDWGVLAEIDNFMVGRLPLLPVKPVFFNQLLDFLFVPIEGEVESVGRVKLDGDRICIDLSIKSTFEN